MSEGEGCEKQGTCHFCHSDFEGRPSIMELSNRGRVYPSSCLPVYALRRFGETATTWGFDSGGGRQISNNKTRHEMKAQTPAGVMIY